MRQIFRFHFVLGLTFVSMSLTSELMAQPGGKPGQRQPQQPANNKPMTQKAPPKNDDSPKQSVEDPNADRDAILAQEKMLDRLDHILARWEIESEKIKSLHGKQSRSEFNHVFAIEKVSEGPFYLETPDKGRIDLNPIRIEKGDISNRMTKPGPGAKPKPYNLETGKQERWICTGDAIILVNDEEKTFQKEVIPEDQRGKNIIDSPLPFLFGMKAEEAKHRFKLSIMKETKESVTLLAYPKMAKDQENYEKAAITLDKKTFLPSQVRLIDQSKLEIVYSFQSIVVNDSDVKSRLSKIFGLDKDPFRPNLKGYQPVLPPENPSVTADIQPAGVTEPGRKDQPRTANGMTRPSGANSSGPPKRTLPAATSGTGGSRK